VARRPPRRPTPADTIGSTSVDDSATERALNDIRDLIGRMQTKIAANQTAIEEVAEAVDAIEPGGGGGGGDDTYGDREYVFCLRNFAATTGTAVIDAAALQVTTTAGSAVVVWGPLPLRIGERLKSVRIRTLKGSSGLMTVRARVSVDGAAATNIATAATSTASGLQTISSTVTTPTAAVANENYYVQVTSNDLADVVSQVAFTVDKVV
jgi:hypothetical protein